MKKFLITSALVAATTFSGTTMATANEWQGVFTSASKSGGAWTAKVTVHATGERIVKKFRQCQRVKAPVRGWACRGEVLNFVFE